MRPGPRSRKHPRKLRNRLRISSLNRYYTAKAVVTLTRDPKKTTVRWKEQNLEKYYSTCEFPGFDKAFIIGDALKSFKSETH